MRMRDKMQIQAQLALTGYNDRNVKLALKKIMEKLSDSKITVNGDPIKQSEPLDNQPPLHGCDHNDLTVISISVSGSLKDVKRLVETKTPRGVMVELLPQAA